MPPWRRRHPYRGDRKYAPGFQSTPPRRRRPRASRRGCKPVKFQSTPPRRRRLNSGILSSSSILISIHASEKEATWFSTMGDEFFYFNPRLREGGDLWCFYFYILQTDFNPRLREGGDTVKTYYKFPGIISIHASEKEATATYCDTSAIMYISSLNNFFVRYF